MANQKITTDLIVQARDAAAEARRVVSYSMCDPDDMVDDSNARQAVIALSVAVVMLADQLESILNRT